MSGPLNSVNCVNLMSPNRKGHRMSTAPELVLANGTLHTPSGPIAAEVAVRDGKIVGMTV